MLLPFPKTHFPLKWKFQHQNNYTPMVTAGLWTKKDIDRLEAGQYRKILRATNKISNKAILHTMTSMNLAGEAVMRLSRSALDQKPKRTGSRSNSTRMCQQTSMCVRATNTRRDTRGNTGLTSTQRSANMGITDSLDPVLRRLKRPMSHECSYPE